MKLINKQNVEALADHLPSEVYQFIIDLMNPRVHEVVKTNHTSLYCVVRTLTTLTQSYNLKSASKKVMEELDRAGLVRSSATHKLTPHFNKYTKKELLKTHYEIPLPFGHSKWFPSFEAEKSAFKNIPDLIARNGSSEKGKEFIERLSFHNRVEDQDRYARETVIAMEDGEEYPYTEGDFFDFDYLVNVDWEEATRKRPVGRPRKAVDPFSRTSPTKTKEETIEALKAKIKRYQERLEKLQEKS